MKREKKYFYALIILLIIINLFLFFNATFGRINDMIKIIPEGDNKKAEVEENIPTGNVDVFNIDINCSCKNECSTKENKDIPVYKEEEHKEVIDTVFVDDKNGEYIYQNNLKIFENVAYKYFNKIAPGSSNTYYFVAHNISGVNMKYNIVMKEESSYKINLKYRLKKNDKYVIGNDTTWVDASKLKTEYSNITTDSSDVYALDWKWFDDDKNDTIAGKNMKDVYKLKIRLYFEEAK